MEYYEEGMIQELFESDLSTEQIKDLKQYFGDLAGYLWLYYQSLRDVGFNSAICYELLINFQSIVMEQYWSENNGEIY